MDFVGLMKAKARASQKALVLPEGTDARTLKAARIIVDEGLAGSVTLVADLEELTGLAEREGISLEGIGHVFPQASGNRDRYAEEYFMLRKNKGITEERARTDSAAPLCWGAMMVRLGNADAMVAGAANTTGDVLRAGLSVIGIVPGLKTVSSCFVMDGLDPKWGRGGTMIFSDCAVVPDPTAEQLADIAEGAAKSCRSLLGVEPVVALLSFSTKGSAQHRNVDKVVEAAGILRDRKCGFEFDGELQLDAALVPSVTDQKAPGSPVRGRVNTLVFPDLGSGNIGYKLVQRLADARAFGPFLQGFAKPISDLSRGASVEDIVSTAAVTLAQVP